MWLRQWAELNSKERDELEAAFTATFSTPVGVEVLTRMLHDLCFFQEALTEEQVALNNYAKRLLSYMGEWREGNGHQLAVRIVNRGVPEKKRTFVERLRYVLQGDK